MFDVGADGGQQGKALLAGRVFADGQRIHPPLQICEADIQVKAAVGDLEARRGDLRLGQVSRAFGDLEGAAVKPDAGCQYTSLCRLGGSGHGMPLPFMGSSKSEAPGVNAGSPMMSATSSLHIIRGKPEGEHH
jgi:hypothetical protein